MVEEEVLWSFVLNIIPWKDHTLASFHNIVITRKHLFSPFSSYGTLEAAMFTGNQYILEFVLQRLYHIIINS